MTIAATLAAWGPPAMRRAGLLAVLAFPLLAGSDAAAFDRKGAYDYAYDWRNDYNPGYAAYPGEAYYHEDANFVSQALQAGGLLRDAYDLSWFADASGNIYDRAELYDYISKHEHGESIVNPTGVPEQLWFGDVVFFGENADNLQLVGVYVAIDGLTGEPLIAYHNPGGAPIGDVRPLAELQLVYGGALFYHFPRPEDTTEDQRFFASGLGYYGEKVISAQVIRPGGSYLGYIVGNSSRGNQDLAIGTDTSGPGYTGCSYLIAGYCCDPSKGVPAPGEAMGRPWTSDSPADYAYWVRKAVEYAVPLGLAEYDILETIWYISSREGSPTEITQAIGFPEDTLPKSEVRNGTFETGTAAADFWTGKGLQRADRRVTGVAHTGEASFGIKGGRRTKSVRQRVAIPGGAGDTLVLSGWSRARRTLRAGGPYRMSLTVFYEGRTPRTFRKSFPKRSHGWLARTLTVSPDGPYAEVEVVLTYARQAGKVWFDDLQLQWAGAGARLGAPAKR